MKFGSSIFLALYSHALVVVTTTAFVVPRTIGGASTSISRQGSTTTTTFLRETVDGSMKELIPPKKVQDLDVKDLYDANVQRTYG